MTALEIAGLKIRVWRTVPSPDVPRHDDLFQLAESFVIGMTQPGGEAPTPAQVLLAFLEGPDVTAVEVTEDGQGAVGYADWP